MRKGYKQTEVGVIPEEWEVKPLHSLTNLMTNGFVGTATSAYVEEDDGIIYIQGYNVQENGFNLHGVKRVSQSFHAQNQKSSLREGDLLTIQTGDVGVTAVVPPELVGANCHALIISRLDKRLSAPAFYSQYLNSERGRAQLKEIETGSTMKHINVGHMKHLLLPSPPLPEQRAIAAALGDVDALITGLDQLIAKKRDIKQATMQQLLTGKQRLPGFGGDWGTKALGEISSFITKGTTPTTYGFAWTSDGIRFLRSECVSEHGLDLAQSMFISEPAHASLIRGEVRSGDILMTITGNVGRVIQLPSNFGVANMNQHIARIRNTNSDVHTEFVYHFLTQPSIRKYYATIVTGQAYPQISLKQVRETQISLPLVPEQRAIAAVLSDMDAEIDALEKRLEKTRALKQGMMQELLTGRIRLV